MLNLNEYFDNIYVLNYFERPDNHNNFIASIDHLLDMGTERVEVFYASNGSFKNASHYDVDAPKNWRGTRQSYNYYLCLWKIVRDAKDKGYRNFLFLEDDIDIQPDFEEKFKRVIARVPQWDMLYLGANHHSSRTFKITNDILRATCALDMHAVAISHTMYDKILNLAVEPKLHENPYCDVTIAHLFHKSNQVFAVYPSIVYQHDGFSGNELKFLERKANWQHPGICLNFTEGN